MIGVQNQVPLSFDFKTYIQPYDRLFSLLEFPLFELAALANLSIKRSMELYSKALIFGYLVARAI